MGAAGRGVERVELVRLTAGEQPVAHYHRLAARERNIAQTKGPFQTELRDVGEAEAGGFRRLKTRIRRAGSEAVPTWTPRIACW